MKKTRWLLSIVTALVLMLGVSLLAVGCTDPEPGPGPGPDDTPDSVKYTLTYEKGEGEEGTVPEVKSYEAGASVTLAAAETFTKEGYNFVKWLDNTTEYDAGATFTMPAKNVTLKAKWEEKQVEVPPVVDKGDATELKLGTTLIILGENDVWEMEEGSEDYEIGRELSFHGKPDTTYTVKIEYKGTNPLVIYFSKEEYVDDPWGAEPILNPAEGVYATMGELDETGEITVFLNCYPYVADDYKAEDFTCTITIVEGNDIKYNVSFYNTADEEGTVEPLYSFEIGLGNTFAEEFEGNDEVTFPALPAPKDNQHCVGWYLFNNLAGGCYMEFTENTQVEDDLLVVPKWADDGNLATGATATTLTAGENGTEIVLGYNDRYYVEDWEIYEFGRVLEFTGTPNEVYTFTLEYHEDDEMRTLSVFESKEAFDAWEEAILTSFTPSIALRLPESGTVSLFLYGGSYDPDNFRTEELSVKVKVVAGGKFELNFYEDEYSSVIFDAENGTVLCDADTAIGELLPDNLEKLGYVFEGWFVYDDEGELTEQVTASYVVSKSVNVYGKWHEDESVTRYAVIFKLNETDDYNYQTEHVIEGTEIGPLPLAEKDGYILAGWFDGETEITADTVPTEDITAIATWFKLPTITFSNGLTGDDEETLSATAYDYAVEDGELLLTLPYSYLFYREGYTLVGWQYVDENGEPVEDQQFNCGSQVPATVEEGEEFVAKFVAIWEPIEEME